MKKLLSITQIENLYILLKETLYCQINSCHNQILNKISE